MTKPKIAIFQKKEIRKTIYNNEWYFSVVDIVAALTDSINPTDYLKKLRKRDDEVRTYIGTNCPQIEMITDTGKKRKTLAGNTETIFRIIQSIPSKKAEPFKRWLAKVGKERLDEIEVINAPFDTSYLEEEMVAMRSVARKDFILTSARQIGVIILVLIAFILLRSTIKKASLTMATGRTEAVTSVRREEVTPGGR